MDAYLVPTVFGLVLSTGQGEILRSKPFRKAIDSIKLFKNIEYGGRTQSLHDILNWAEENGIEKIIVEDEVISTLVKQMTSLEISVQTPSPGARYIRNHLYSIAKRLNKRLTEKEYTAFQREVAIKLLRRQIQKVSSRRDNQISQAVEALDEINKTINLFSNRLREWYGLHFPEINRHITDHEILAAFIVKAGDRERLTEDLLIKDLNFKPDYATKIFQLAKQSFGAPITSNDLVQVQLIAQRVLDLFLQRRRLEKYIENTVKEVAPNLEGLIGPIIAARLLSIAGGLDRLARMPSSTIQVLGADKALFR
ncbi:MAG: hypothetical protein ACTSW4_04815, partial [Candidatus Ranarchaeia archaeon]